MSLNKDLVQCIKVYEHYCCCSIIPRKIKVHLKAKGNLGFTYSQQTCMSFMKTIKLKHFSNYKCKSSMSKKYEATIVRSWVN